MKATSSAALLAGRIAAFGFGLVLMVALLVLLAPRPAHAVTLTVNSTADPGSGGCNATECTLREAIDASNASSTVNDTITFDIPASACDATTGVCTITPTTQLPSITDRATIDGYEQEGALKNTSTTNTNNAVLKVELILQL